jgi:hypothetical protein
VRRASALILAVVLWASPAFGLKPSHHLVSWSIMQKAIRVNQCEEGGNWHVRGSIYAGGLGWTLSLWPRFKAKPFPASMADASPEQQAWAMAHFVGAVLHYWPDQWGCTGPY